MPFIILGEPFLGSDSSDQPQPRMAPYGQLELCMPLWEAHTEQSDVIARLREEYLAIAHALKVRLQLDFRVAHVIQEDSGADKQTLGALVNLLGCRFVGFTPEYNRELIVYPCDLGVELPGINLINHRFGRLTSSVVKGEYSIVSPYGEAGRTLFAGRNVFVAERRCLGMSSEPAETSELVSAGLNVGLLPNLLSATIEGNDALISTNDHLDRVSQMLWGKDGKPHLVIDPQYWSGPASNPANPQTTLDKVRKACEAGGVTLHIPKAAKLRVPYSLNLVQFPDGRVLMTCGDDPVAETVEGIAGSESLYLTEIPISFFPAFRFAGIRCLIGQVPTVLFKKHTGSGC